MDMFSFVKRVLSREVPKPNKEEIDLSKDSVPSIATQMQRSPTSVKTRKRNSTGQFTV
jgi:hypothetical protein